MSTTFERWFSSDWVKLLHNVPDDRTALSNGYSIQATSWDRRAAYLYWVTQGRPDAEWRDKMAPLYDRTSTPEPDEDLDSLLGAPATTVEDDGLEGLLG